MKWIVNPDLIDEMNESEFSMILFPTDYFEKMWGNVHAPHHRGKDHYIDPNDVNHICDFVKGVKFFGNSYCGEKPYIEYGRTMIPGHSKLANSDKYVTLVTFTPNPFAELCSSHTITARMLFVKESAIDMRETTNEEEKCYDVDIPDTRIRGLIQSKTTYSFDVSKLTIGHPYRIRFLGNIDIFDKHYKYNDEIYGILAEVTEEDLKFATIHDNVTNIGSAISSAFQLKPDMKFELHKLV